MPLVTLLLILMGVGIGLWVANRYIPMNKVIRNIVNVVVIIFLLLWLLGVLGIVGPMKVITVGP